MIVGCSACKTRFEAAGYRDVLCPTCGAFAHQANVRQCPRCELPFDARQVSDVVIDECSRCRGLFLDEVAIQRVLDDKQHARAAALLAALPRAAHHPMPPPGAKMYIKCPSCASTMNRKLFAVSGVVVDVCRDHGTFFDAGELPAIIDFVQRGGLEKTAKVEAARNAERDKRDRAEAERLRNMPSSHGAGWKDDGAAAFIDLLFSLFH